MLFIKLLLRIVMNKILSTNYMERSMKESTRNCVRKVMIDGGGSNLVDELIREDLSDSERTNGQRHERPELKNGMHRAKRRLTTFPLRSMINGRVQCKFNITCFLCKRRFACNDSRSTFLAYCICDDCMENEKGHAEEFEATLSNNDKARSLSTGRDGPDFNACNHCKCQNCVQRQVMNKERRKETEVLQRCWHDLRQNVREMFRDGLNANMTSSKGKQFDVDKIKRDVTILAEKDPHQLYKRLESIGHEYVMNLKSDDLWQILVAPQVVPDLIQLYEGGASEEQMELERAKLFIKTLLDRFSCQQETARNMSPLLAVLDEDYLSQFGISWKVVNHHIFDRVIYQDDLLLNYLPSLENALKCKLIVPDEDEEDRRQHAYTEASFTDIPQGVLELAQNFRIFHKLMVTSREIFKKANANIVLYTEQQKIINHIKQKAKGGLLKEDLEFFKIQRKMIRNCILRTGQYYQWHADLTAFGDLTDFMDDDCDNSNSETEDVNLSKTLRELIEEGPAASACIDENGEVLSYVRCKRCAVRHCSCDECRISHIITCSLLIDSEDMNNLIWPVIEYCDEHDDRDSDSEHLQRKISLPNIKHFSSNTLRFQAARTLFTLNDHLSEKETAWGDWEVPYGYSDDIDYLGHCLYEERGMRSEFGSLNNQTDEGEERTTEADLTNSEKYHEIVKEAFEVITEGYRMESSPVYEFESYNVPRTSSDINDKKRHTIEKGDRYGLKSSFLMKKTNLRSEKPGFTIASVSNINVKKFEIKKTRSNVAEDSDGTECDYETSSTSFPGSNECMDNCNLSEPDRLLMKEITRRHYAVLSKNNAASDLALEIFGQKMVEKPHAVGKTELTLPISRVIRKSKFVPDKSDANSGGVSGTKFLSVSAGERLLGEMADMDKKDREGSLLRLIQSYEDEHWTAKSAGDYKSRLLARMKECLCKEWAKEDEAVDLRTSAKNENYCSTRKIVSRKSTANTSYQEKTNNREVIYIPETRTVVSFAAPISSRSVNKKPKPAPRKVEHEKLAQLWSKQALAAVIAKQLTSQKTVFDSSQISNAEKRKTAKTVSCKVSNHLDTTPNPTRAIDFSVNLSEFDINTLPDEVRKFHEDGKLKKLLQQAMELRRNKTGVCAKVTCKHNGNKRVESESKNSKEELFGSQANNVGDIMDADDEGTDEEWRAHEAHNEQHLNGHHPCGNKIKNKTAPGPGRDSRRGHCDCCYCAMFGRVPGESVKSGRAQIRERLRMKLKRRSVQEHVGTDRKNAEEKLTYITATQEEPEKSSAVIPDMPIEEILDYINEKDIVAAQAAASKAAKRARQKLRKQEEKERQNRERKLKEERKKVIEAEILRKKQQQATQQEVKKEKQSKPELKKKADRVRGKKQKDGRDRKKENGSQLSEIPEVEVQKEPVLEFEYWNDPKYDSKFKRVGSAKEEIGACKVGRSTTQNKEESKTNENVPERFELIEKRENEKNASSKDEIIEADSAVGRDGDKSSKNEKNVVKFERTLPDDCVTMLSKTENHENGGMGPNLQLITKLPIGKESNAPSTAVTGNRSYTILSEIELSSQSPKMSCPITTEPSPKSFPLPQISQCGISQIQPIGPNNINVSQRLPFPVVPVLPPSQTNTDFGICQGGVGYYTHFGEQPQVYLINGLSQCFISPPDQNLPVLSATSANFAKDPVSRPLQTFSAHEARSYQIGINVSSQYSVPPPIANAPVADMLQRARPISPVFDPKLFQTATSFSCHGFQKLQGYASETPLSSSSPSLSSSFRPPLCGPSLDVCSFKGNTTQIPSLGVMSAPFQSNSCGGNGTAQNFPTTFTAAQGFALSDSSPCPKHSPSFVVSASNAISDSLPVCKFDMLNFKFREQDVAATKMQNSSQCINNAQFPVNHRSDVSDVGSVKSTAQSNKVGTSGVLPGPIQNTATVCQKRNEESRTFLSSSSSLADYDSETRKLAAFAKEDDFFHNQKPRIFEPGDPRIAVAIAEMKFDPHEAFKPRPDSELEFLDPVELEVENFKRALWDEGQLRRPRMPLRELRRIEPENEPGAVFYFAPLV